MNIALETKHIIDCLKTHYGIDVTTLTLLPLGADIHASRYKAQTSKQSSYFVKLNRHHDNSTIIMELLTGAGIQHLVSLVKTIRGETTQHIDSFTMTVSPFIEGQNGFHRNLTDDQWVTLGKVMKEIHSIAVPFSIQEKIRRESFSPQWRQAVRSLYPLLESKPSGDEVAINLLTFIKKQSMSIDRLVDRAEALAKKAQDQTSPFVLCHSDLHAGNILIDENNALYIVDWNEPIMAPKERDLMFIGGGVANIWNKPHESELFYKGYGKTDVNRALLAYYRHERIIEDIAVYAQQLLLSNTGSQDRMKWYQELTAQFEPHGVVEIAFKTDENL